MCGPDLYHRLQRYARELELFEGEVYGIRPSCSQLSLEIATICSPSLSILIENTFSVTCPVLPMAHEQSHLVHTDLTTSGRLNRLWENVLSNETDKIHFAKVFDELDRYWQIEFLISF